MLSKIQEIARKFRVRQRAVKGPSNDERELKQVSSYKEKKPIQQFTSINQMRRSLIQSVNNIAQKVTSIRRTQIVQIQGVEDDTFKNQKAVESRYQIPQQEPSIQMDNRLSENILEKDVLQGDAKASNEEQDQQRHRRFSHTTDKTNNREKNQKTQSYTLLNKLKQVEKSYFGFVGLYFAMLATLQNIEKNIFQQKFTIIGIACIAYLFWIGFLVFYWSMPNIVHIIIIKLEWLKWKR